MSSIDAAITAITGSLRAARSSSDIAVGQVKVVTDTGWGHAHAYVRRMTTAGLAPDGARWPWQHASSTLQDGLRHLDNAIADLGAHGLTDALDSARAIRTSMDGVYMGFRNIGGTDVRISAHVEQLTGTVRTGIDSLIDSLD